MKEETRRKKEETRDNKEERRERKSQRQGDVFIKIREENYNQLYKKNSGPLNIKMFLADLRTQKNDS